MSSRAWYYFGCGLLLLVTMGQPFWVFVIGVVPLLFWLLFPGRDHDKRRAQKKIDEDSTN